LHGSLQHLLDGIASFFRKMTPELALTCGHWMKAAHTVCRLLGFFSQ
jgi:hypothetical protein